MKLTGEEYDKRHPEIWLLFVTYALKGIDVLRFKGVLRKNWRLGSKSIFEQIRDNERLNYEGRSFKLSNNMTPYYARKFMLEFPEFDGVFKSRKSTLDKNDPETVSDPRIVLEGGQGGLFEFRPDGSEEN